MKLQETELDGVFLVETNPIPDERGWFVKTFHLASGSIIDVILDIRKNSPTFGKYISIKLSSQNRNAVYIEPGLAHGFASLENDTCVTYLQTTSYSPEHDRGIRFDSFGMEWGIENPIVSSRDSGFPRLQEFDSPFIYKK
jgi:dTDP-4-dehydrorhamnose 3,5-epimerase/CDP-3, 6-dideoxy-D-glycero-D-glycero-4-hexulose-5-epimerase